jgi:5-methyltetrahydropteroyltriglutamate--homocysteine methyltransferase
MKTPRTKELPLFYTQVIGSLPRPALVRELLQRKETMPRHDYKTALDDMVRFAIRLQEVAGLDVVSDGEWRRRHYVGEFLDRIGGFEKIRPVHHAGELKTQHVVVRRIEATQPVWTEDARFLVEQTKRVTKFAIPSPFLIAIRYWHREFSAAAYPTLRHFMEHLTTILRREAEALAAAGIDIIQIDDPALTYYCDRCLMDSGDTHDDRLRRSWNIEEQFPEAVEAINAIVEGLNAEIHLHCCHSVYKRQSDVKGNYAPILPRLSKAMIDQVNLEFAYQGTGAPEDLKLLPSNFRVGMGIVDVRGQKIQTVDEMEAIVVAGAKFVAPERIALNPDCGFAPDFGEPPTIDEAFEKLHRMCQAAARLRQRFHNDPKRGAEPARLVPR